MVVLYDLVGMILRVVVEVDAVVLVAEEVAGPISTIRVGVLPTSIFPNQRAKLGPRG